MSLDHHIHPQSHGEKEFTAAGIRGFARAAQNRGLDFLGFADHDIYHETIDCRLIDEVADETGLALSMGLEFCYWPGREDMIARKSAEHELDFAIGSVHHIDGWPFDHPDYRDEYAKWEPGELFLQYFDLVRQAAESGFFEIIGHLDLIKIFYPELPVSEEFLLDAVDPVLKVAADRGLVIEVNTNGCNRPTGGIYPEPAVLARCAEYGIPLTFSSDAHRPERVGEGMDSVLNLICKLGYRRLATFANRRVRFVPIRSESIDPVF